MDDPLWQEFEASYNGQKEEAILFGYIHFSFATTH